MIFGKTGSKSKEVHESSSTSLATRIVKIERIIEVVDTKLDNFINLVTEERKKAAAAAAEAAAIASDAQQLYNRRDAEHHRQATSFSSRAQSSTSIIDNASVRMWSLTFPSSNVPRDLSAESSIPHSFSLPPPPPSPVLTLKQSCKHCKGKATASPLEH